MKATSKELSVFIPQKVFRKIMYWINKSNNEVSGFGNLEYDAKLKMFTVVDAFLIEQVNSGTTTEIAADAMGKMMFKQHKFGPGACKWWWHSHVRMNVFWSGTDESTIREYGGNGYIVASVFNKYEEVRSAVCYKAETVTTPLNKAFGGKQKSTSVIMIDNVQTLFENTREMTAWDAEYAACVKEYRYVPPTYNSNTQYNSNKDRGYENPYHKRGGSKPAQQELPQTEDFVENWEEEYEVNRANSSSSVDTKAVSTLVKNVNISKTWEKGRIWVEGVGWVLEADLDAATNPDNEANLQFSEDDGSFGNEDGGSQDGENLYVNGILGDYGIEREAKALSMAKITYERTLAQGTDAELDDLTNRLTRLEQAGYFENDLKDADGNK